MSLASAFQIAQGLDVVTFDETLASFAILFRKIESARCANQPTSFSEDAFFFPLDEFTVSLADDMRPGTNFPLGSLGDEAHYLGCGVIYYVHCSVFVLLVACRDFAPWNVKLEVLEASLLLIREGISNSTLGLLLPFQAGYEEIAVLVLYLS